MSEGFPYGSWGNPPIDYTFQPNAEELFYAQSLANQQQQQQYPQQYGFAGQAADPPSSSMMMYPTGPSQTFPYSSTHSAVPAAVALSSPDFDSLQHSPSPLQSFAHPDQLTPTRFAMAAPGLVHPGANTPQHAASNNVMASPLSPHSPKVPGREQQRINLLLEINAMLLQRLSDLQAQDQGGAITPQQAMQLRNEGKPDKMASEEFVHILKRLQANLTYLQPNKTPEQQAKAPPGPVFMSPPPQMPQMQAMYDQLRELFPGWPGLENMRPGNLASPRTNAPASTNGGMMPMNQ